MPEKFIGIKGARGIKVNHQTQHNKAIMQVLDEYVSRLWLQVAVLIHTR